MTTIQLPVPTHTLTEPRMSALLTMRAEWTKLRTLRSTWLTLSIAVVASIALGALASASDVRDWATMTEQERAAYDPTSTSLVGVLFGALVLGALGVRTITAEYATGMIRTTAAAIPSRTGIIWSKLAVLSALTFVVATTANGVGFLVGQAMLSREDIDVSITSPNSIKAIVFGALAVTAFTVIGVGLGTIVRRASVANILMALVVIGGSLVGQAIPSASQRFLPFSALQATVTVERTDDLLGPLPALGFLVGYAVIAVAGAMYVVRRRDI